MSSSPLVYLRLLYRVPVMAVTIFICYFFARVLGMTGALRVLAATASRVCGREVEVIGAALDPAARMIVANHVSYLDTIPIYLLWPACRPVSARGCSCPIIGGPGCAVNEIPTTRGPEPRPSTPPLSALAGNEALTRGMPFWRRLQRYADLCATCGYLPDPPTPRLHRLSRKISRGIVWALVGRIEASGLENLRVPGPKIIISNHPRGVDPFLFLSLLSEPARYMAARGVMTLLAGRGALAFGPFGAFCVDPRPGKRAPAVDAGVRALTSGQTLVMFPEAWAHLDGVTHRFKTGAVRIAREAAARLGRPVPIVPVRLRYGAQAGAWITRFRLRYQFLLFLLGLPLYRRGLRMTAAAPILSSELPADNRAASAYLRETILSLDS